MGNRALRRAVDLRWSRSARGHGPSRRLSDRSCPRHGSSRAARRRPVPPATSKSTRVCETPLAPPADNCPGACGRSSGRSIALEVTMSEVPSSTTVVSCSVLAAAPRRCIVGVVELRDIVEDREVHSYFVERRCAGARPVEAAHADARARLLDRHRRRGRAHALSVASLPAEDVGGADARGEQDRDGARHRQSDAPRPLPAGPRSSGRAMTRRCSIHGTLAVPIWMCRERNASRIEGPPGLRGHRPRYGLSPADDNGRALGIPRGLIDVRPLKPRYQ